MGRDLPLIGIGGIDEMRQIDFSFICITLHFALFSYTLSFSIG